MPAVTLGFIGIVLLSLVAFTQNAIEIDPANAFLQGSPGQTLTGVITVKNLSRSSVTVDAFLQDFWLETGGRLQLLPPGSLPQSIDGWASVEPPSMTIPSQSELEIRYRVKIPADAPSGTHWSAVVFRPQLNRPPAAGISIRPVAQLAYILYVNVGENRVRGRITALRFIREKAGSPALKLTFENNGATYFTLAGKIELRDPSGKRVASQELSPRAALPGGVIEYTVPLEVQPGTYLALAVLHGRVPGGESYAFTGQARFEVR